MSSANPSKIRSVYRSILRELPHRPLSSPSPLKHRIRSSFMATSSSSNSSTANNLQAAEQYVQYARAQRMYATLLERYNPGMGMDEERGFGSRRGGWGWTYLWSGGNAEQDKKYSHAAHLHSTTIGDALQGPEELLPLYGQAMLE